MINLLNHFFLNLYYQQKLFFHLISIAHFMPIFFNFILTWILEFSNLFLWKISAKRYFLHKSIRIWISNFIKSQNELMLIFNKIKYLRFEKLYLWLKRNKYFKSAIFFNKYLTKKLECIECILKIFQEKNWTWIKSISYLSFGYFDSICDKKILKCYFSDLQLKLMKIYMLKNCLSQPICMVFFSRKLKEGLDLKILMIKMSNFI